MKFWHFSHVKLIIMCMAEFTELYFETADISGIRDSGNEV
jgi:hypothetical protein